MAVSDFLVSLTTWPLYLTDKIRGSVLQGLKDLSGTSVSEVRSYFGLVSQIVPILSLVLIAVDRFIATVFLLCDHAQVLRRSTNYYSVNMAVSDFLVSLTTWPLYLTDKIRGSVLQGLKDLSGTSVSEVRSYFGLVSQIVPILSLVLIAVDRFIATVFPLCDHAQVLRRSTNYYSVNMAVSDFLVSLTTWPLYLTDEIRGSLLQV